MPWLWLIRARRWLQNPPSMKRVILGAVVIGLCLSIALIEWMGWWPEAFTVDHLPRRFGF